MKKVFENIYRLHHWYNSESRSGPGASLHQTEHIRRTLPILFDQLFVKTLLDIPCGDFHWMKEVDLRNYDYCGADIVTQIVKENELNYASSRRRFIYADITSSALPKADLILCRDCLVHLSYKNIRRAIENIIQSKSKYLLTTTFPNRTNRDIRTGGWRVINLQSPPFSFPMPLALFNENCTEANSQYNDKSLALWKIDDLHYPRS